MPAGYSGTPLAKKLGIKAGDRVALLGAPAGFEATLDGLPEGASLSRPKPAAVDGPQVMVVFVKSVGELTDGIFALAPEMPPAGSMWIAWPKKSSGIVTDMTEDRVRDVALPTGLVDNKVCAIDDTWSGLRLVVRKEHRAGWPGNFPVSR
jgi:hypothetical protein